MYINARGLSAAPPPNVILRLPPNASRPSSGPPPNVILRMPPRGPVRFGVPLVVTPRGIAGLGQVELSRPGPSGGTEIVDPNGNIIYTEAQVAADPSLLTPLSAAGVCPGGLLPTWFPGGESTCAGGETIAGGSNTPAAQFNYPVAGACPVEGWCFTGSSMTDPNSFTWTGAGSPTSPNPATQFSALPLPVSYTNISNEPLLQPTNPIAYQPTARISNDPAVLPASVAIVNTSRPGQPFQAGDTWQLTIKGTPNQQVSASVVQNGGSLGTSSYGDTDANGSLILNGSFDPTTVGSWSEMWTVGTTPAPVLTFSVAALPAGSSSSSASAAPSSSASPAPAPSFDLSSITSMLTQPVDLFGVSVPVWGIGAAAIVALYLFGGSHKR